MKEEEETKDTDPPDLVILHPESGQHFETSKIAFEGKTEPGARVFAGDYEADVDDEGNWRIVLILNEGGNLARFTASDEAGNKSTAEVKAYYDAPKDEKPVDYEFTAHQKYGSCSEEVPYDKWYGTGTPGQQIWIGSDYGSGTTTVGEDGNWDIKVEFPEAPCGDEIAVVESVKAASEIYTPLSGEIVEVNKALADEPGTINESAEADGWFFKMKMSDPSETAKLMDAAAYKAFTDEQD